MNNKYLTGLFKDAICFTHAVLKKHSAWIINIYFQLVLFLSFEIQLHKKTK